MATEALPTRRSFLPSDWLQHWPLVVGLAAMALPTLVTLGREVWSREIGAHGPIVLATGLWLLIAQRPALDRVARPGPLWLVWLAALPCFAVYAFARAYDFISLEAAAVYGVFLAVMLRLIGLKAMAVIWFPLAYLAFLVPPPGWVIDRVTAPLRLFISHVVTEGLAACGLPITRDGVTMMVAQYRLFVEDACSGMNSIIGLTAITLLYIYLMHRASWRYAALLMLFILPIAVIANMLRVTVLVLLTYYAGDAVAQGFLHVTAGLVLFMIALSMIFALDAGLQKLLARRRARA